MGERREGKRLRRGVVVVAAATAKAGDGDGDGGEAETPPPASVVMGRVRARFGIDPAVAPVLATSLDEAWTPASGMTEEDEAELLDAVADCLSVGLPLDAALASLRADALAYDADEDGDDDGRDAPDVAAVAAPHAPGGRRLLVR